MVLWIDANIILDVLQNREPYVRESSLIWKLCETGQVKGFISTLTFANLVYVLRKELTPEISERIISSLMLIFGFADLTRKDLCDAARMKWKDYEDALQVSSAVRVRADYIITRNLNDFADSPIPPLEPADFLQRYKAVHGPEQICNEKFGKNQKQV